MGLSQVLFGVSFAIAAGEMVTLMGRNGMGKTTTVRSIMGLTQARAGTIRFLGRRDTWPAVIQGGATWHRPRAGRAADLSESLRARELAGNRRDAEWRWLDAGQRVWAVPRLAERDASMGNQLSGGEQQMLAIARALMTNPRLLILDEATEGLAPLVRAEIWRCLARLKESGPVDPGDR
jgi:branched-chain amino acid transport system ATP-binding protein